MMVLALLSPWSGLAGTDWDVSASRVRRSKLESVVSVGMAMAGAMQPILRRTRRGRSRQAEAPCVGPDGRTRRLVRIPTAMRPLPVLGLAIALHANAAPPADPLKSDACGRALAALQAARAPDSGRTPAQVEASRREATQACLGGNGDARRPSPTAQAPLVVPPPAVALPRPAAPPEVALPAPPIERPAVITACDAGGCWDSSGRRLNRAGPLLIGPGGACVKTGLQVRCP